jgi:hypothetical protein
MDKQITLICTPLKFYIGNDEDLCFQWIKKIKCVKEYYGIGRELHLLIESNKISNADFNNLRGLFARYKFKSDQLKVFINKENEHLGFNGGYHENIYPYRKEDASVENEIVLRCTPLCFYTKHDEDLMFRLIKKIKCIDKCYGIKNVLYLCIPSNKISHKDLSNLICLFSRYNFDKKQLTVFMNETNKNWFINFS